MRSTLMLTLVVSLAAATIALSRGNGDWPVRAEESVVKKFVLSGAPMRVDIDNVSGYIHATGVNGSAVEMHTHEIIRAETDADLAEARREVTLNYKEDPGAVSVLYDAPWRCRDHNGNCSDSHRRFYEVTYDIDISVPREARLVLSTVNRGDVLVSKSAGPFEVRNVNGAISMDEISGSGDVNTVNGPISVRFVNSPSEASSFKTVNGSIDAYFPHSLSADLLFKTFNGQVYADFDVAPLAVPVEQGMRENGKFVYRGNHFVAGRVGHGGSEYKFETLNGNIRLHERD